MAKQTKAVDLDKLAIECIAEHVTAVRENQTAIDSLSRPLLKLAEACQKSGKADAIPRFKAACKAAEKAHKEQAGVTNLKDALPSWVVYKSHALRALKAGFDLSKAVSFNDMMKRTVAAEKAKTGKKEPESRGGSNTVSIKSKALTEAVNQFLKDLTALTVAQQDVLAVWIKANLSIEKLEEIAPIDKPEEIPENVRQTA